MFNRNEIKNVDAIPTRIHYPWFELEEYHPNGGMWATSPVLYRGIYIKATSGLMANPDEFANAMRRALKEWPKSVAVALTTPGMNHRAWIGHAGCFLVTGSPEETTRLGWHQLDEAKQRAANAAADTVIGEWRRTHAPHSNQMSLWENDA